MKDYLKVWREAKGNEDSFHFPIISKSVRIEPQKEYSTLSTLDLKERSVINL